MRDRAEGIIVVAAILASLVLLALAARAAIDCHRSGGRAVKNMLDWPVCVFPATESRRPEGPPV